MTEEDRNNICRLMCLVVLADKKVFMSEINAFARMLGSLQDAAHLDNPMNEADIREWFADHRYEIESWLGKNMRRDKILELFGALKSFHYKKALFDALTQIAVADDVLHASEIEILKLGAAVWNIDPPEGLR